MSAPGVIRLPRQAVILAAGRSTRLGAAAEGRPKSLLRFGGRTLMDRHLEQLAALGVDSVVIVTGYRADVLRAEVHAPAGVRVRFAHNARFEAGNILSLRTGLAAYPGGDVVVMDADVLYEPAVLERLAMVDGFGVLLDDTSVSTGEEMMCGVLDGRVRAIARGLDPDGFDLVGETVGFLRIPGEIVPRILDAIDAIVADGGEDADYEAAVATLLDETPADWLPVGDLAWIEIDFPEDLERARREVYPLVSATEESSVVVAAPLLS